MAYLFFSILLVVSAIKEQILSQYITFIPEKYILSFTFKKNISADQFDGLIEFCIFAVKVYVKHWFTCTKAAHAPLNDLNLLNQLQKYKSVNVAVANGVIQKLQGHTWYLSNVLIGLSFFDTRIDNDTKVEMVKALKKKGNKANDISNKSINATTQINITDLVCDKTLKFFKILSGKDHPPAFLRKHPSDWDTDDEYRTMREIVSGLAVVNDAAERTIGLIKQFNNTLTKSQEGQNDLLQSVENFRQKIPDSKKKTICDALNK